MRPVSMLGLARCLMGSALLLAPDTVATSWVGKDRDRDAVRVYSRATGVREFLLGVATMSSSRELRRTVLLAGALCDGVDFAATLAARRHKRVSGDLTGVVVPGLAAAVGLLLANRVAQDIRPPFPTAGEAAGPAAHSGSSRS